jgi:hypothetical protein
MDFHGDHGASGVEINPRDKFGINPGWWFRVNMVNKYFPAWDCDP